MDVIKHFSCHTKLPIKLRVVRDHVMETAKIDHMSFFSVDIDSEHLMGMMRLYQLAAPHPDAGKRICDIMYSNRLLLPEMRVICTKEMIHASDGDKELAKTKEQVDTLVEEVGVPQAIMSSLPGRSDGNGLLYALAVLLPRDALVELRKAHKESRLSVADIAKYAMIPELFVRFALGSRWEAIVERMN